MDVETRDTRPPRSSLLDWRRYLRCAATEHEIVNVARDYVATWALEDLTALPDECRPGRVVDGEDISQFAYHLARAHCSLRYDDEQDRLLMRMLAFMSEAAVRLAEVKAVEAAAIRP